MKRSGKAPPPDPMQDFEAGRALVADSAAAATDRFFEAGAHKLDALFGEGYARAHPDLLGRYVETAAGIFEGDMASIAGLDDGPDVDDRFDDLDRRRR